MTLKKFLGLGLAAVLLGVATIATVVIVLSSNLPQLITVEDYEPLLVSEVYDREGVKIGEFFREKRELIQYQDIPEVLKQAFIAAEDSTFFEHGGINYIAIFRAVIANIKAGYRAQGASTITQQVARTLLLTREKTYTRKIKEAILAYRMEANLSKEEILYLYLNQIYLGHGAWGVGQASKIYFRKPLAEITVAEAAILAGLPKAPGRYTPILKPERAKERQRYVLTRMAAEGFITEAQSEEAKNQPVQVYLRKDYKKSAPYFLETVRQMLVKELGEQMVLDKGIKIYTGLDIAKQQEAQKNVRDGLRELDKRQGYRGAKKKLEDPQEIAAFLKKTRDDLMNSVTEVRVLQPDGSINDEKGPLNLTGFAPPEKEGEEPIKLPNIPAYIELDQIVPAIVTKVDDEWGLVYVRFAESKGLIDLETMGWAREPDPKVNVRFIEPIEKPSLALSQGDIIEIKVAGKTFASTRINDILKEQRQEFNKKNKKNKEARWERPETLPDYKEFARVELEQEPRAQGSLISLDQNTQEIISMIGGYDFKDSKFNRAIQAARQTGSAFKALVYAAALDKGYNPATPIIDAPIVYEEEIEAQNDEGEAEKKLDEDGNEIVATRKWRPMNHSKRFSGDILFRNALIRSLNVPTVKIIENIGVPWAADYARRLGIFSPLNLDFTLALGSSGVTLYEVTRAFAQLGKLGKRIRPLLVHRVEDREGNILLEKLTLDERFDEEVSALDEIFEERRENYLEYKKNPEKFENKEERETADADTEENSEAAEDGQEKEEKVKFDASKEPPLFFKDKDQLLKPETAYIMTTLLQGVVEEQGGTGRAARALGRPVAGKTGSTSDYYDAWFVGYTPDVATGVWVGYDNERTLGKGEVGGRSALPIWLNYMKFAHEGLPTRNFAVPDGIVFANIDNETGKLASASSKQVVRQAFMEGTEPKLVDEEGAPQDDQDDSDFFKEDMSE